VNTHLQDDARISGQGEQNLPGRNGGTILGVWPRLRRAKTICGTIGSTRLTELNPPRREMKAYMRAKAIPATQSGVVEISDCPL